MYQHTDSTGLEIHRFGRLDIYIKPEGRELDRAVHQTTGEPFGPLLTLTPKDFQTVRKVLKYTFEDSEEPPKFFTADLWRGSNFSYLAPMADRSDLFWISCGPLNVYLPTEKMREVFR